MALCEGNVILRAADESGCTQLHALDPESRAILVGADGLVADLSDFGAHGEILYVGSGNDIGIVRDACDPQGGGSGADRADHEASVFGFSGTDGFSKDMG